MKQYQKLLEYDDVDLEFQPEALEAAAERLNRYKSKVTLVQDNFSNIDKICRTVGINAFDGMLFDLGVSSPQLDDGSRGFSYIISA